MGPTEAKFAAALGALIVTLVSVAIGVIGSGAVVTWFWSLLIAEPFSGSVLAPFIPAEIGFYNAVLLSLFIVLIDALFDFSCRHAINTNEVRKQEPTVPEESEIVSVTV